MYKVKVLVSGKVQKVWFRKQTQTKALEFGLTGWVILAEGDMDNLSLLTGWLQDGPPLAKVKKISIEWFECESEHETFEIL